MEEIRKDNEEPKYITVVGASAGGLNSIIELSAQLSDEMNLSVFFVLHITETPFSDLLIERIQKNTLFTCKIAENGERIRRGHIYMALPDSHLLVKKGKIILGNGPPENRWRPSIDTLFRSAAVAYSGRVIAIILSGMMHDGTAGMLAVKRCGGTCIVQDPREAEYPDMPLSVLNNMRVEYCVPLIEMGAILLEKSRNGTNGRHNVPLDVAAEAEIAERVSISIDNLKELGEK